MYIIVIIFMVAIKSKNIQLKKKQGPSTSKLNTFVFEEIFLSEILGLASGRFHGNFSVNYGEKIRKSFLVLYAHRCLCLRMKIDHSAKLKSIPA